MARLRVEPVTIQLYCHPPSSRATDDDSWHLFLFGSSIVVARSFIELEPPPPVVDYSADRVSTQYPKNINPRKAIAIDIKLCVWSGLFSHSYWLPVRHEAKWPDPTRPRYHCVRIRFIVHPGPLLSLFASPLNRINAQFQRYTQNTYWAPPVRHCPLLQWINRGQRPATTGHKTVSRLREYCFS